MAVLRDRNSGMGFLSLRDFFFLLDCGFSVLEILDETLQA